MVTKKPSRRDAYEYISTVRDHFQENGEIYDTYLKVLKDFHSDKIGPSDVRSKMIELFTGHQDLLLGFTKFLPEAEGSKITLGSDQTQPKKPEFHHALDFVRKVKATLQDDRAYMSFITILKMHIDGKSCLTEVYHEVCEVLLRDHPDLHEEFAFFLPSYYREGNVTLAISSPQKYIDLNYSQPQVLRVSAGVSIEVLIGKDITEDMKEKKEVRFGTRFFLTDCREKTTGFGMKAALFGKNPGCVNY
ncbi:hypothetical protein Bca4012_057465 [Brassica carinata]|uniref:Uncharacterized protein n=1 Tax=Brassica carinata TaxID=52824 RepID=A0A8X8B545_BRACI|nr:hypothetical protein Bca52824_014780 [Brassica carinata]